ncbi:MAG: DUF3800 domain-containing protein [Bryobacteraceae bacterium]
MTVLKAYFDGSGKSDDPSNRFLTLVGYAAEPYVWRDFEAKWIGVLEKHHVDCRHMKEDQYRENPVLLGSLLNAIQEASEFGMRTASCTVALEDHRRLSKEGQLPRAGRICAEFCINELLAHATSMSCFFDRGEEFLKEVKPSWEKDSPDEWPELARIDELGQVRNQKDCPGVQAADWLAWYINRSLTRGAMTSIWHFFRTERAT